MSVIFDRSAIEIRRYGRPMGLPVPSKLSLIATFCGRGISLAYSTSIPSII